jgi:chemotaxis protein MotB
VDIEGQPEERRDHLGKDRMMRTLTLSAIIISACFLLVSGCSSELDDLRIQNSTQQRRIDQLMAELEAMRLDLDQKNQLLAAAGQRDSIEMEALQQKIAALEEDIAKKEELIASMQQRLLLGGAALPVELNTLLEDFAKQRPDLVAFDANRGVVKFKSDLLFELASDKVAASAVAAVQSLCKILNTEEGKQFDVIIAGHTDDIRIATAETRAKHPTNWHLSVHRAISVLNIMESNGVDSTRLSARGFGEFRPIVENLPGKKGNPQNRRVEIYIVPKGV